ncbi:hypothetical protein M1403_02860 [Patescibacteria group bacterium]|nr:hypothetical protein [Patescibacteria group bacterium]
MCKAVAIFLCGFVVFLLFAPKPALAQGYELLPAGQSIDSDYFRTGQTVQIDGDIHGDAFLAGGVVTVNGKIDGDLFVLGGKVNVNGEVGNSIRVVGGDVTINAPVSRNTLLICGNCSVTKQSTIGGSLLVTAANLELSAAQIGRGFRFFGSRLYLNSPINNEAYVVANREFLLGPQASISSSLKYTGNSEAVLEPGATIAGNISYQKENPDTNYPRFFGARTLLSSYQRIKPITEVLGFVVSALIGFLLLGLFPRIFEKTVMAMENRPAASFGWGIIIALMAPLVVVLFAITIVGIPVSLVLLLVGSLAWVGAQYLTAFFIGRKIMLPRFGERRGWALLLGLFLIALLGLIPIAGALVKMLLVVFALGAAVLAYKQPVIIEPRLLGHRRKSRS